MVYNRKKALREYQRQAALTQSWSYIHTEMERFMREHSSKTPKTQRKYLLYWCRATVSLIKNTNTGFPPTKAQRSVSLLLSRTIGNADTPLYNAKQLYLQSLKMI